MGLLTPTVVKTSWSLLTSLEVGCQRLFSLSMAEKALPLGGRD